jgi:hypothetical protein
MWSGRIAKARRGELAVPLPAGLVRRPSGEVVLDPDEQAQALVRLIFEKFEELGTARGVLLYVKRHRIRLPFRVGGGPNKGQVEWRVPSPSTIYAMLHHPFYAGAYARGRRQLDPRRKAAGRPHSGRVIRPMDQWEVLLPSRLPAYISWERAIRSLEPATQAEDQRHRALHGDNFIPVRVRLPPF